MPDEETFALNKKIEIRILYKKDTRNLHYTLKTFKILSKHSLVWLEQIKSAEFISCTVQDLHKKKQLLTLNNFKNKTHLLNPAVHRVQLHSEMCGSALSFILSRLPLFLRASVKGC